MWQTEPSDLLTAGPLSKPSVSEMYMMQAQKVSSDTELAFETRTVGSVSKQRDLIAQGAIFISV